MSMSSTGRMLILVATVAAMLAVLQLQTAVAQPPSCSESINNLNICAPFVVPGTTQTAPSGECCSALQSVDHECLCNTIRIASRIPAQCNLPPLSCAGN